MAEFSRARRIARTVATMFVLSGTTYLVTACGISLFRPLMPEEARDALAREFPELADAEITEREGHIEIGGFTCDLSKGTWRQRATLEMVGKEVTAGRFERWPAQRFGWWRTVETERMTLLCVYFKP